MNTMPTATQPYGYSINIPNCIQQTQNQTQQNQSTTNIIFVSGIEDVKTRWQAPNTEMFYADNDKPLLYKKQVYANGQFDVKTFDISEHSADRDVKEEGSIDLSSYAKTSDLGQIESRLKALEERFEKYKGGDKTNGTNTTIARPTIATT